MYWRMAVVCVPAKTLPQMEISESAGRPFYKQQSPRSLYPAGARSMFSADEEEVIQAAGRRE